MRLLRSDTQTVDINVEKDFSIIKDVADGVVIRVRGIGEQYVPYWLIRNWLATGRKANVGDAEFLNYLMKEIQSVPCFGEFGEYK